MESDSAHRSVRSFLEAPEASEGALLLTGPWGCGKTHLAKLVIDELEKKRASSKCEKEQSSRSERRPGSWVERIRRKLKGRKASDGSRTDSDEPPGQPDPPKLAYVSLIGVSNDSQFFDALFTATWSNGLSQAIKGVADLGRQALSSHLGLNLPNELIASGISNTRFVFDDLERAELEATKALALIYRICEVCKTRALVIANESELGNDENYRRTKEKGFYPVSADGLIKA